MKTYFLDLIPKLQRFSQKLDDLTYLTNQHWVVIEEITNSKNVYIFRTNNELLISQNGKVEKARWEYLGNNSIIIDKIDESYLFKHGFLDENVLALKIDSKEEYSFFVNENKYEGDLNSINKIVDFLTQKYIEPTESNRISKRSIWLKTDKGIIEVRTHLNTSYTIGDLVYLNGDPALDGKYIYGWPSWFNYLIVKNGKVIEL